MDCIGMVFKWMGIKNNNNNFLVLTKKKKNIWSLKHKNDNDGRFNRLEECKEILSSSL